MIPALRFPEFKEEWRKAEIGWFLEKSARPVRVQRDRIYREIGLRSHGKGIFHKTADVGHVLGDKRVFWVVPSALVLNIVFAWEQAVAVTSSDDEGFIASHRFPMFVARDGRADTRFARDFFLRPRGKWLLGLASPGGAGRNKTLGQSDFTELKVVWPSGAEQKKIADFLEAVDSRTALLQRKAQTLNRYKSEALRRLFTRELRFQRADGSDFPEWQTCMLRDVLDWKPSNSLSRDKLTTAPRKVQNIHYGDVHSKFPTRFRQSQQSIPYIENNADTAGIKPTSFCEIGDLVIADASEDYADIGKAIEIVEVAPQSLVAGLHTHLARPKHGMLAKCFGGYLLQSPDVRRQIMRAAQGISVLGISKAEIGKVTVELPHVDEQRRIAAFLSALDDKIDAIDSKFVAMQTFKKGLLQQMFV